MSELSKTWGDRHPPKGRAILSPIGKMKSPYKVSPIFAKSKIWPCQTQHARFCGLRVDSNALALLNPMYEPFPKPRLLAFRSSSDYYRPILEDQVPKFGNTEETELQCACNNLVKVVIMRAPCSKLYSCAPWPDLTRRERSPVQSSCPRVPSNGTMKARLNATAFKQDRRQE